jgi:itaconate CoA-transferase
MTGAPLEGVVVVALEQAVAGPLATRHLADMGARVIKIERVDGGDFARSYDETVRGLSSAFVWLNRSKESLTLDLKHSGAAEVLLRLVSRADVFVQNLAPGAADRLGLSAARLHTANPRLVVCNISGYGLSGPYRDKKAYDLLIQGEAGLISATGTEEHPAKVGISIADIAAGMYAYSGILSGLYRRERTGDGSLLDVSMFDSLTEWMGHLLYYTSYGGSQPRRAGTSHSMIYPYGPFDTKDGRTILLAVQNDREWLSFCTAVLGNASLATDPRFSSTSRRVANRSVLESLISARLLESSADDVLAVLDAASIASAQVNSVADLAVHPQLDARERWRTVDSPAGKLRALVPPAVLEGTGPRLDPVPALGEHNDGVLQWLGYTPADLERMRSQKLF